jgi:hypothetical protein
MVLFAPQPLSAPSCPSRRLSSSSARLTWWSPSTRVMRLTSCKRMFHVFQRMLQLFHMNVAYVASVCSKCFICFRSYVCKCFYLDVAYVSHILQEYVPMVSVVSVLCYSKCFHVASCKCFIRMLHMYHTHVLSVYFKCLICFRHMLHSSVSCLEVCSESHGGMARARGDQAWRAGCRQSGRVAWLGPADGVCARSHPGS